MTVACLTDQQMRELMREEGELEEERKLTAKMMAEAKATAPRLATLRSISKQRHRWVTYKVGLCMTQPVHVCGSRDRSLRRRLRVDALAE